jgi:hypothetical protein
MPPEFIGHPQNRKRNVAAFFLCLRTERETTFVLLCLLAKQAVGFSLERAAENNGTCLGGPGAARSGGPSSQAIANRCGRSGAGSSLADKMVFPTPWLLLSLTR